MGIGGNRANDFIEQYLYANEENVGKKPCVFLSHRSIDKPKAKAIAAYIAKAGIDYYLDEEDEDLQQADEEGNDINTVSCIQRGIECSSHILCILSETTVNSWWVPYEVGYGESKGRNIASIKTKMLPQSLIPAYLRIRNCMMGLTQFNEYLRKVSATYWGLFPSDTRVTTEMASYCSADQAVLSTYNSTHPLFEIVEK